MENANTVRRVSFKLGIVFFIILVFSAVLPAESGPGLTGVVRDQSGSLLPGVTVTATAFGSSPSAVTDKNGRFAIPLSAGTYTVSVQLSGFKPIQQDVTVTDTTTELTFTMEFLPVQESVVVSASRIETSVTNSPVSVSVINSNQIATSPAQNYGDLLREVPGLNVIQLSARDVNLTSRQSTSILADTQLALLDGRSVYEDFFGFVLWDLMPIDFSEIKQVEVVRGPASAVWGANAMSGVVNIITKPPLEMLGTTITLSAGFFDRDVDGAASSSTGNLFQASVTHAQKLSDKFSYKLSMGYFDEDPFARPVGHVPVDAERKTGGAVYPNFENKGTRQPKLDLRLDQELDNGGKLSYSGGVGGTDGFLYSGIGPFDISNKTYLGYGKVGYSKKDLKINFFANLISGDASNVLTLAPDLNPVHIDFKSQTYDGDFADSKLFHNNHLFSFGGNLRHEVFDLSAAPNGENRTDFGGYLQDDIFFQHFRFVLGARLDKFSAIDKAVFSPRVTFMYKPTEEHTMRFSVNRAFRSPSLVENSVDLPIVGAIFDLGLIDPRLSGTQFPLINTVLGNPDLRQESLTAYEISYAGSHLGSSWTAAFYVNDTHDIIDQRFGSFYSAENPPPGWPLPTIILTYMAKLGIVIPATIVYDNLGSSRDKGLEFSFNQYLSHSVSAYVNYSWQADPVQTSGGEDLAAKLNLPAHHRFNIGMNVNQPRYLGSFSVSHTSEAFWADVLDAPYHGFTKPFTMVNASFGMKWHSHGIVTSIKVTNLLNQQIQQHIFGDILKRSVTGELKLNF